MPVTEAIPEAVGSLPDGLPNLLVIGAAKCGTTSIHFYLDQHPQIAMSEPKELRYFWRDDWRSRLDSYAANFDKEAPLRGESTPGYTIHPCRANVADRVHSVVPDAKLIYLVRDPIDRAVSHWAQARSDSGYRQTEPGLPRWTLAEAVAAREDPMNAVIAAGRYATQLDLYLRHFDLEQILIVDYDELRADRAACMRRVFEFLGVDAIELSELATELNTRDQKRELSRFGRPLWNHALWPLSRALPRRLRSRLGPLAERLSHRPVPAAELTVADRSALEGFYRPEVERLREISGQGFDGWSI